MADGKATRTAYPDTDRPLYTPDADERQRMADRIRDAMKKERDFRDLVREGPRSFRIVETRRRVIQKDIAAEWGRSQTYVSRRLNDPTSMNTYEVETLCDLLEVTPDYLMHGGANGYGRYEGSDVVVTLYESLDPRDKETLWRVLESLAGAERVNEVRDNKRVERLSAWIGRHPDEWRETQAGINKALKASLAGVAATMQETTQAAIRAALDPLRESLRKAVALAGAGQTDEA